MLLWKITGESAGLLIEVVADESYDITGALLYDGYFSVSEIAVYEEIGFDGEKGLEGVGSDNTDHTLLWR